MDDLADTALMFEFYTRITELLTAPEAKFPNETDNRLSALHYQMTVNLLRMFEDDEDSVVKFEVHDGGKTTH